MTLQKAHKSDKDDTVQTPSLHSDASLKDVEPDLLNEIYLQHESTQKKIQQRQPHKIKNRKP